MDALEWYKYSPLKRLQNFRLLLNQGSSDHESRIRCRLVEIDFEQPPHYVAISYTWEGQIPSQEIEVDGSKLFITRNAEEVLKQARPDEEASAKWIWIDSVCIDQSEQAAEERNGQVSMMYQIYSKAACVLIWLGHSRIAELPQHRKIAEWMQRLAAVPASEDENIQRQLFAEVVCLVGEPGYFDVYGLFLLFKPPHSFSLPHP